MPSWAPVAILPRRGDILYVSYHITQLYVVRRRQQQREPTHASVVQPSYHTILYVRALHFTGERVLPSSVAFVDDYIVRVLTYNDLTITREPPSASEGTVVVIVTEEMRGFHFLGGVVGGRRGGGGDDEASSSIRHDGPTNALAQVASSSSSTDAAAKARHDEVARSVLAAMTSSPNASEGFGDGATAMAGMPSRGGNLSAVRSEEAFQRTLWEKGRDGLLVVKFGASWCTHCAGMLPEFGAASREYPDAHFVLADVDTLPETAADVRYTPTFSFFHKGRKVDEITKTTPRGLRDHMWMHAPDSEDTVRR